MIVNVIKNHVVKSIQKVRVGFEISAFAGMELSGKSRPYVGTRIGTLSSGLSLMLEAYYPLSSLKKSNSWRLIHIYTLVYQYYPRSST